MNNSVEILSIIQNKYPDLQDEFLNYVESILMENADTFETANEIQDSIEGILNEIDASKADEVYDLCCQIFKLLVQKTDNRKPILLNNPICIGELVEKNKPPVIEITKEKLMNGNTLMSDEAIKKNLVEVEEKMNKKMKKKQGNEMPTLLISQQFSKNITLFDKDDNNEENATTLTNFVISNFDMSFGSKMLLKDASISISIGRRYGLIGRNGLGKTTLLKAISTKELKLPSNVSILLVEQEVIGDNTKAIDSVLEADIIRTRLLKELEDINTNKNQSKNSNNLTEIYQKLDLIEADKAPSRACNILKGLGFSPEMQIMTTQQFSGGWRMRLSLARALFSQPDLLLLDEPTNMLDMKAVIWLENYLKTWKKSLIIVSHDQKFLDSIATDILFLNSQKIEHYKCNYSQFEESRQIKLTNQMKEYESQMQYREHVQVFIDRFRTYTSKAAMVQSRIKMLEKLPKLEPVEKEVKVVFEFPSCPKLSSPVLQADELCFGYNNTNRIIINKLVISVGSHSRICIVGENGAGKSTLLKLFMNELEPQSGMLRAHKNLRIGFFSQHHVDQLVMNQSSLEFLQTKFPGFEPEYYRGRLGSFGIIGDVSLRPIYSLSGGQKSRVAFTILSMKNPNFLILDEPTNHLDMQTISALGEAIRKFEGGVILVSHDERLINNVCEELWLVEKNGNVSVVDGGISKYREMVQKEF